MSAQREERPLYKPPQQPRHSQAASEVNNRAQRTDEAVFSEKLTINSHHRLVGEIQAI